MLNWIRKAWQSFKELDHELLAIIGLVFAALAVCGFLTAHHTTSDTMVELGFVFLLLIAEDVNIFTGISFAVMMMGLFTNALTYLPHAVVYGVYTASIMGCLAVLSALATKFIEVRQLEKVRRSKSESRIEREKLVTRINELVGNDQLARGFLAALERLTEYVPEEGKNLLESLMADLEEYQVLGTLIASTKNDVLKERSEAKQAAIQIAAQELCAKLTEEAIEAIRVQQADEADGIIDHAEPRLVQGSKKFSRYLEGLKETRELTPGHTGSDRALSDEIKSLGDPTEMRPFGVKGLGAKQLGRG